MSLASRPWPITALSPSTCRWSPVSLRRGPLLETPLGVYEFRHIKTALLRSYQLAEVGPGQQAFVATPEKALLDLVYLQPGSDSPAYLRELRLQNLDRLNLGELLRQANLADSTKLQKVADFVAELARTEAQEYKTL